MRWVELQTKLKRKTTKPYTYENGDSPSYHTIIHVSVLILSLYFTPSSTQVIFLKRLDEYLS
jgi:hypothetical protein